MSDTEKQYRQRDLVALDREGGHYFRHVRAMTAEGLHDKTHIAAELAARDWEIERLRRENAELKEETGRLTGVLKYVIRAYDDGDSGDIDTVANEMAGTVREALKRCYAQSLREREEQSDER